MDQQAKDKLYNNYGTFGFLAGLATGYFTNKGFWDSFIFAMAGVGAGGTIAYGQIALHGGYK